MLKHLTTIFGILLLCAQCKPTDTPISSILDPSYQLVFEDHFDNSALDTLSWYTHSKNPAPYDRLLPRASCDFSNAEILLDRNIAFENDHLKLSAKKETFNYKGIVDAKCGVVDNCNFVGCDSFNVSLDYTSASISSQKGYNHGYFECRAKIPSSKGLYPVFWLWHHDEIVVFEFFGTSKNHFVSLHNKAKYVTEKFRNVWDYGSDFHIYSVEWTPYQVRWFLDRKMIKQEFKYYDKKSGKGIVESDYDSSINYKINTSFPDSKDRWMSLNLSLRVYEWSDHIPDESFPAHFLIDYVTIYQKK